ncbi:MULTISPECIES: DUF3137 domain-containing protein [unclassified Mycoplasma]|uniref:DUF3137 domain-containing protein n=1 Tax=unclassified Mycoplasma TaxID=2683645 RepID=UPI00211C8C62|nr:MULTISPECIES: DUF3137 domain-containing protein [unclassified Mycoplasma]UUM20117.1 DUF3137 domain-containing protein [Mycoplasma sp. 1578d]UUM25097.1 DUF3137 domain-containing protein [Mycoplasma sp. 3686d]
MKIIKEYLDFDTFKSKCDDNIYPLVVEKVEKYFSGSAIQELRKMKNVFITSFVLGALLLIASIWGGITVLKDLSDSNRAGFYGIVAVFALAVIFAIIGTVFWIKFTKAKQRINSSISSELAKSDHIYEKTFKNISPEIEYVTSNNPDFVSKLSLNENPGLTRIDLETIKPDCQNPPTLISANRLATWLIDNKYPVEYYFLHWQYIVQTKNGERIYNVYRGAIKVYTDFMGEKSFDWTLNTNKFLNNKLSRLWSHLETIKLENNQFNSTFKLKSNDRQSIFRIFTPFAQELLVKRVRDKQGILFDSFKLFSSNAQKSVLYDITGSDNFMKINAKISLNKDQVIKSYYSDIVQDTYTFYYMLCFVYIPLYFE